MGKHTDYGMPSGHRETSTEDIHKMAKKDRADMRLAVLLLIVASVLGAFVVAMT